VAARGECGKGVCDDAAAGLADAMAPVLVSRRIGPQLARAVLDRGKRQFRAKRRQIARVAADHAPPLRFGRPEGDEERIVEVEQDGARQCHAIAVGACGTDCQKSGS
jgi:hypothetical protein